jgi:integrase/recombinase XerD
MSKNTPDDPIISKPAAGAGVAPQAEIPIVVAWKRFIQEKQFIKNLSPATIYDYGCAWNKWMRFLPDDPKAITEQDVQDAIIGMRASGLSAISTNSYLRVLKVWLRWLKIPGADGMPIRVEMQQAPRLVPRTFSRDELTVLLHIKAETMTEKRIYTLMRMYLDTGARAEELLALRRGDVNMQDQLLAITGKGARERVVPFSLMLRADIQRWMNLTPDAPATAYLFPTTRGHYAYRNCLRDFVEMAKHVGIIGRRVSLHTFRHSFATHYIQAGGDPMRLQRVLGHSTLTMTQKYVSLQTRDLSAVHEQFSPLSSALAGRGRR